MAVDDCGCAFTPSPDPLLDSLQPYVADIRLGEDVDVDARLRPILENETVFGVNLYEAGLADAVCRYFGEMIAGAGAVLKTLEETFS